MGTTKKPAPRRKRPATGKGKPAVKVQAPRQRKKKPAVQNIVLPPVAPGHYQQVEVPPAIISRIKPMTAEQAHAAFYGPDSEKHVERRVFPTIPAEEIERRSEQVRLRDDEPSRAGDIALTVLFVVFVLALIARSAV